MDSQDASRPAWLFTAEQLKATPSRQDGMEPEKERAMRKSICKLIAEVGQHIRPKASVTAVNSGKVFFHRIFMVQSLQKQNPKLVGITCLFLACKSEECPRHVKQLIWTLNMLDVDMETGQRTFPFGRKPDEKGPDGMVLQHKRPWEISETSEEFQRCRDNILTCERICLHVLGFELNVEHPVGHMPRFIAFFDRVRREDKEQRRLTTQEEGAAPQMTPFGNDVWMMATAMANDSTSTTLCLQYGAGVLAAGCLNLALKTKKFQISKIAKWVEKLTKECREDSDARYNRVAITEEEVKDVCSQLLDLYDEAHSQQSKEGDGHDRGGGVSGHGTPNRTSVGDRSPVLDHPSKQGQPRPHSQAPDPKMKEKADKLEAGEKVLMTGSGPKPYELQKDESNTPAIYRCSCSIWRHIGDMEHKRTCKHLQAVRGYRAELGRVGEEGIKKCDAKFAEFSQAQAKPKPPAHPQELKRKAEGVDGGEAKRQNTAQ